MMFLLAQVSPAVTPASTNLWLVGAIVVGGGLVIGPLSAFLTVFITRREVEARLIEVERRTAVLERHVVDLGTKMEADKDAVIAAGEQRAIALHNRIEPIVGKVGRIEGLLEQLVRRP